MKQPYVLRDGWIEPVGGLEGDKKVFPLLAKTMSDIVPQSFDTGIVDTSTAETRCENRIGSGDFV